MPGPRFFRKRVVEIGQHEPAPAGQGEKDEIPEGRGKGAEEDFRRVRGEPAEDFEGKIQHAGVVIVRRHGVRQPIFGATPAGPGTDNVTKCIHRAALRFVLACPSAARDNSSHGPFTRG